MSDIGQILLLPPPLPVSQRMLARESDLAANTDLQAAADQARARRFRFRVVEGGEAGTDIATRRTDPRPAFDKGGLDNKGAAEDATGRASSRKIRYAAADSQSGNSSAFLAQVFAQEQLGEGLHNPPFAQATTAYSRTGAALNPRASAGLDLRA